MTTDQKTFELRRDPEDRAIQRMVHYAEQRAIEETQREAIKKLCVAFQIPLTVARTECLEAWGPIRLGKLFDLILALRAWPEW